MPTPEDPPSSLAQLGVADTQTTLPCHTAHPDLVNPIVAEFLKELNKSCPEVMLATAPTILVGVVLQKAFSVIVRLVS